MKGTNIEINVEEGLMVLIDTGGSLYGYQSDISRSFSLSQVPQNVSDAFEAVRRAQLAAMSICKPGFLLP